MFNGKKLTNKALAAVIACAMLLPAPMTVRAEGETPTETTAEQQTGDTVTDKTGDTTVDKKEGTTTGQADNALAKQASEDADGGDGGDADEESTPVAQVGDETYASLGDAFDAASEKGISEVKLLEDFEDPTYVYTDGNGEEQEGTIIYNIEGITFDLNGKTYTSENFSHIFEGSGGKIINGSMVCANGGSYALFIGDDHTDGFTVENVKLTGGINIYDSVNVNLINLDVTATRYYAIWLENKSEATVRGGIYKKSDTIKSEGYQSLLAAGISTNTTLKIESGTFLTSYEYSLKGDTGIAGTLEISGGTFDTEPDAEYVADGYAAILDGENYKVVGVPYEIRTTSDSGDEIVNAYPTLTDAIAHLDGNKKILVARSCTLEENVTLPAGVALEVVTDVTFTIGSGASLTVAADSAGFHALATSDVVNNGKILVCGTGTDKGYVEVAEGATLDTAALTFPGGYQMGQSGNKYYAVALAKPDTTSTGAISGDSDSISTNKADVEKTVAAVQKEADQIASANDDTTVTNIKVEVQAEGLTKSEVPAEDAKKLDAQVKSAAGESVALYVDVKVLMTKEKVTADGDVETTTSNLSTTMNQIPITLKVPGISNKFVRILHVHEGVTEELPCTVDQANETVTVLMNKFSTLAVVTTEKAIVTFDSKGGSSVSRAETTYNGTIAKPADPTRSGYRFKGWYTDADCKNAFDFSTKLTTQSLTLYAKWEEKSSGSGSGSGSGSSSSTASVSAANTGDTTNIWLPVSLLLAAGLGIAGALTYEKKKQLRK